MIATKRKHTEVDCQGGVVEGEVVGRGGVLRAPVVNRVANGVNFARVVTVFKRTVQVKKVSNVVEVRIKIQVVKGVSDGLSMVLLSMSTTRVVM